MAGESSSSGPRDDAHGIGFWARYLLVTFAAAFVLCEIAARMLTETAPNGVLRTKARAVYLLPLRPSEEVMRQAIEGFATDRHLETDADLGWNLRRDQDGERDRTNAAGFRAEPGTEYANLPSPDRIRIMTLGDSFVYGTEVKNDETFQVALEAERPDLELLNLGLPGGGTDQAILRWRRDGKPYWSHVVLLGIWPDNVFRNVAVVDYYRTMSSLPLTKPRLVIDGPGAPRFVNAPIMSREELVATLSRPEEHPILAHDYWYREADAAPRWYRSLRFPQLGESVWRRYQRKQTYQQLLSGERPEAIDTTVALVELFAEEVRAEGSLPVVMMIPDFGRLELFRGEDPSPLLERLEATGVPVIDMGESFGREVAEAPDPASYYFNGGLGHHTPSANVRFAVHLEQELRPLIEAARALRVPEAAEGS